jgi:RNA binding exosome subunit
MIERVEVTAIAHATEDPEKVLEAIANLLGLEDLGDVEATTVKGHHGNPITYLKLTLKGKKAKEAFENLINMMDDLEFELLLRSVEERSERSKLYLRFDKQRAYLGEARLSGGSDVVRFVVVFKGKVTPDIIKRFRKGSEASQ